MMTDDPALLVPNPMEPPPIFSMDQRNSNDWIDLEEIFNETFYEGLPAPEQCNSQANVPTAIPAVVFPEPVPSVVSSSDDSSHTSSDDNSHKRTADQADLAGGGGKRGKKNLTKEQALMERRERNREHAKRCRLRKKHLFESQQKQIQGLEEQVAGLKNVIKREIPDKAAQIITSICGDKEKYRPLSMPSGFGPVKTLMEPDFRLTSALSGSQQTFIISDPKLPDNPIVFASQGFLDLTGYTMDEVMGRNLRFLQGAGTDQKTVQAIRKGIEEGVDTSVCLLNYKADGTPFWNQLFVAGLRDSDNNVVNYVGVQREVSKAVADEHMKPKLP